MRGIVLITSLATQFAFAGAALGAEPAPDEPAALPAICTSTVRIMPLGDSITKGSGGEVLGTEPNKMISYRKDLWDSLLVAGFNVDFVGSQTNGQFYPGFDAKHNGYGGVPAEYIRDNVYSFLTATPADVILLHIGTNDLNNSQAPQQVADEVNQILDNIDQYEKTGPHITVILAQIINKISPGAAWTEYNSYLDQVVQARPSDDILLVNMETGAGIIYSDYKLGGDMFESDKNGLHPYHTGYTKMAAVWKQAIDQLFLGCNNPPTITNPGNQSSSELQQISLQVNASDPDQGSTLSFTAENLPPGLSINSTSGLITGQIAGDASQGSPYPVKVTVTDDGNPVRSSSASFTWVVQPRKDVFLPLILFRNN